MYRTMRAIRAFEEKSLELYAARKLPGNLHNSIGQEAIAVGAVAPLRADDYIVSTHRCHAHLIAKGVDKGRMMAEICGKAGGLRLLRAQGSRDDAAEARIVAEARAAAEAAAVQIVNLGAKIRYMSGGQVKVPCVIRAAFGARYVNGATHVQSLEAFFQHVPGIKVVLPSNPADAKGLLKAAARDDNIVLFLENKGLYLMRDDVPAGEHVAPLGQARVAREGADVTVLAYSAMVQHALTAADQLAREGIRAEVLDLRTLVPLDREAILASVRKTHRAVIAHEACRRGGPGARSWGCSSARRRSTRWTPPWPAWGRPTCRSPSAPR